MGCAGGMCPIPVVTVLPPSPTDTFNVSTCPPELWANLTNSDIRKQTKSILVVKNGPRYALQACIGCFMQHRMLREMGRLYAIF